VIAFSFPIHGGDFDSAGLATRTLKEQLAMVGVGAAALRRAMIASYEAEMNVVIHAHTGTLWARLDREKLDLEVADEGPGIPDVELAMREGWSTASARAREMGFGAGMGLPNIRRNSDLFQIESRVGRGTRIRSTILLGAADTARAVPAAAAAAALSVNGHSCRACMRCVFACPVAALRVTDTSPALREDLCIGCTACIGQCSDSVFQLRDAAEIPPVPAGSVLVVSRGFISGFPLADSPSRVLAALRTLGFAEVRLAEEWEEALWHEARSSASPSSTPRPLIPPYCPAVVALVESRFPSLIPNLGPWLSPLEAAGEEFPLRPVFVAAACPAQFAALQKASVTGRLTVVSAARLARAVTPLLSAAGAASVTRPIAREPLPGELSAAGFKGVQDALSAAEAGALGDVSVLGLFLCEGGCAGSPLLSARPVLAGHRWQRSLETAEPARAPHAAAVRRRAPYAQRRGTRLDPDMGEAIRKLSRISALADSLPGRDCGACGAPSCGIFAEDVVLGRADAAACPHRMTGGRV
jgi:serine/threonine-protein kinase RsbT